MATKSTSTERVRRLRERQAKGKIRVVMELDGPECDALEAIGILKDWNTPAEDREAIAAVARLRLREWLDRETRSRGLSEDLLSPPNQNEEK